MDQLDRQLEAERNALQRRRDDARARFEVAEAEYRSAEAAFKDAEAQIEKHLTLVEELLNVRRGEPTDTESPPADEVESPPIDEGGTTKDRVRRFFIRVQRPAALVEIVDDVQRSGSTARRDTIRGIVYDMVERGELRKVKRGVYRFMGVSGTSAQESHGDLLHLPVREA